MADEVLKSMRSIAFVVGIGADEQGGDTLVQSGPLAISRHSEREIALWQGMHSRVIRETQECEDGGTIRREANSLAVGMPPPWWPVHHESSDPERLSRIWALQSTHSGNLGCSVFAGGRVLDCSRAALAGLLLLRLASRGHLQVVREMLFFNDETTTRRGTTTPGLVLPQALPSWSMWHASAENLAAVRKLVRCLWDALNRDWDSLPDDCQVAVQHFLAAQTNEWDSWELDLWICLEAMFGEPTGELILRLSQRCALFASSNASGYDVADRIRKRYAQRSKIVHGSRRPSKRQKDEQFSEIYADKAEFEDVVRIALRRYLRLRLIEGVSRRSIHDTLARAVFDRSALELLAADPVGASTSESE